VATPFLASLSLERLTPSRLWTQLPAEVRALAARSLYAHDREESSARQLADAAIVRTLRFRELAVRRLPVDKRVEYLVRAARPDDSLSSSLLLALHMEHRRPMLAAFLDALGIPNENGAIADGSTLAPQAEESLGSAARLLLEGFPAEEVEVYLASLLAMDPDTWGALAGVMERFRNSTK
jgi:hypothetical protein